MDERRLDVRGTGKDIRAAMQAALARRPDVLFGPYGSGPMLGAARACERALWNHGGASSRLRRPAFPQVINVLAPASTYFSGALHAAHTVDPSITTISLLYSTTGFAKDVAERPPTTAANLRLDLTSTAFAPSQARAIVPAVPDGDVLLVVGNFADELLLPHSSHPSLALCRICGSWCGRSPNHTGPSTRRPARACPMAPRGSHRAQRRPRFGLVC